MKVMNDELSQFDADLKGLFVEEKIDEMREMLTDRSDEAVKELCDHNWNIIKNYYEKESFGLLFKHFKFVAYSCFIVEYSHQRGVIGDDVFGIMMQVYNDIYELKRQNR
jgi:hypothetical protein